MGVFRRCPPIAGSPSLGVLSCLYGRLCSPSRAPPIQSKEDSTNIVSRLGRKYSVPVVLTCLLLAQVFCGCRRRSTADSSTCCLAPECMNVGPCCSSAARALRQGTFTIAIAGPPLVLTSFMQRRQGGGRASARLQFTFELEEVPRLHNASWRAAT